MRKILFLSIIVVVVVITACNGRASAVDFNNKLIETQNKITGSYNKFEQETLTTDSISLLKLCDSLLVNLRSDIDEVKKIETPEGGAYFKETALILFEKYNQMIEAKMGTIFLSDIDSVHIQNKVIEEFNYLRTQADSLESLLIKAQQEFAETNKLVIKTTEK